MLQLFLCSWYLFIFAAGNVLPKPVALLPCLCFVCVVLSRIDARLLPLSLVSASWAEVAAPRGYPNQATTGTAAKVLQLGVAKPIGEARKLVKRARKSKQVQQLAGQRRNVG